MDRALIESYLKQTEVLRAPKNSLSTFGATRLSYHLVSPVEDLQSKTRLREGKVLSRKPMIITPEAFAERFEGFGDEAHEFARWLTPAYRDLLRALEYNFTNEGFTTRVLSEVPHAVAERIVADLEARDTADQAVIRCPDGGWSLALMKFTLDQAARSFPTHVRDLERRSLFDPEGKAFGRRRREIESLFTAAVSDPSAREMLGGKLREYGLLEEFEDRFLALF